jgi:fructokinase
VFVAGSNLLTQPGIREATYHALDRARASERFVVLDPNVRLHLWPVREEADVHVRRQLDYGDVVKLNEEELAFLRDDEDAEALWEELSDAGVGALIVTEASAGARVFWPQGSTRVDAPTTDVVDTTGAGDGFVAGLVCGLTRLTDAADAASLRQFVRTADAATWRRVLRLGCHVGSSVCEQYGATPALPFENDIPWTEFE